MGLINPILVNSTNANDATAVGGSAGSVVYHINTTTNRVDTFIYYQAKDVANYAIVNGSVLEPADANFTTGTGDRSGGSAFTGHSAAQHYFLGIAQATMTANYYGYAQRTGRSSGVNTETMTPAAGDLLCIDGSNDGEAALYFTKIGTITDAKVADNTPSIFGVVITTETAGTPDLTPCILCPILNLVGG